MADTMAAPQELTGLLKEVSRSFYLTVRALPGAIRPQIGLAYLLARATDTLADTDFVPVAERLRALADLRARILGESMAPLDFSRFACRARETRPSGASTAEQTLLTHIEDALAFLDTLDAADQRRAREVLATITSGQELDLRRFSTFPVPAASPASPSSGSVPPPPIIALQTDDELDDYTYRVAGCVGEFWTRMCRAHLFPNAPWDEQAMLADGVRFGQGLQLVNILRDLPADLARGRCYVPGESLSTVGLEPADLLDPENEPKFRPVYDLLLARTEAHLAAGWEYTNALPEWNARVRLACAWPILIGVRTLARLRRQNVLDARRRIKITRAEVRGIILRSIALYAFPSAWHRMYARSLAG